jgi:hypothetical protein
MRKFWSGVIAATFVASVSVAAAQEQAPRPTSPGGAGAVGTAGDQAPSPARGAQGGASKSITVSGCIQSAPGAAAKAEAGGAGASASAGGAKYILAMKAAGGAAGGGAVGTAGSGGTKYQLDGDDKTISPHVNHQVEITGTLEAPSASAGAGAGGAAASAGPTLKVDSLKMVSATCS